MDATLDTFLLKYVHLKDGRYEVKERFLIFRDFINKHGEETSLIIMDTSEEVLFTNPSARAGYDTRSVFKRSLTGLNSEFSFS